jgi:hypothetical protein
MKNDFACDPIQDKSALNHPQRHPGHNNSHDKSQRPFPGKINPFDGEKHTNR